MYTVNVNVLEFFLNAYLRSSPEIPGRIKLNYRHEILGQILLVCLYSEITGLLLTSIRDLVII